jgi:predicted nucleic acid-binding protein
VTVLVDTSAWIEFLRGTGGPEDRWLRAALADDRSLAWTEPILLELASGVATPRRAAELRALLQRGPLLRVEGLGDWEAAAGLRRTARAKGLEVRSPVDCLIAAVAVREGVPILARDRDYAVLARVGGLELVDAG